MPDENKPKKIVRMSDILPPSTEKPQLPEEEIIKPEEPVLKEEEIKVEEPEKLTPPEYVEELEEEVPEEQIFPEGLVVRSKKRKKKFFIIIGLACLILVVVISYFSLSKAEIIIKPKTETMQFKTDLNVDKNLAFIDLESNNIPAQIFQVEQEKEKDFPTTKEKEVQERAMGVITVYNQYSSAPQTLVKGTRFVSEEKEKLFRTTETITIPGAQIEEGQIIPSSINVKVEAAEPGKEYNIGPSSFTIPGFQGTAKYTGFYGKSTEPMTGGAVGRVKVASAEDIQGAKDILAIELKQKAKEELEKRIPSDLTILKDASIEEVVESSSSVEADQPAEKFTVKVKVAAKILGFSEKDAISLINNNIKEKISGNKTLIPDTIKINYAVKDVNLDRGTARISCEVKEDLASEIDIEELRQTLAGKNEIEVRQYLASRPEIESAKVIFWPFWVKKIPEKESKIKITID